MSGKTWWLESSLRRLRSMALRGWRRLTSTMRVLAIRMSNSGVTIPWSVVVGAGVRIRVTDGGFLTLGPRVSVGDGVVLTVQHGTCTIGEQTFIGHGCTIVAIESIEIGAFSLLGEYTSVRDQDHQIDLPGRIADAGLRSCRIDIADGVWIGARTAVLKGCHIEEGAVVGANSVVNGRLLARSVNVGSPARQVRMRSST